MHKKHLSYEEAISRLKQLETTQKRSKQLRSVKDMNCHYQTEVINTKKEINLILSIIKLHKDCRKMFAKIDGWAGKKV